MKRPDQHVIDSEADALFRSAFADWSITPSERDYGWDYVVEVFRNGESTGVLFNVQLKGSRQTAYSADGTFISQTLEMDSAEYLAKQLEQPTFLVHVDVERKQVFWSAIQLDEKVLSAVAAGVAQSLTVRIPTANALPAERDRFVRDLAEVQKVLLIRGLLGTSHIDFVEAMRSQPVERRSEIAEDFHQKGFLLELENAHAQAQSGDVSGAITAINKVVGSASATGNVDIHFNAVLQRGNWEWMQLAKSSAPQARTAELRLVTAQELCRIARRSPKHLHLAAQIMRQAAELGVAVQRAISLLMSWHAHRQQGRDPLWIVVLSAQLNEKLRIAHRKYKQALRLAGATARSRYRWVTSRPIGLIATEIGTLAALLENCGLTEPGRQYQVDVLSRDRNILLTERYSLVCCSRSLIGNVGRLARDAYRPIGTR